MAVPFGVSIGDIVTLSALAVNLYRSCKSAGEGFKLISEDVNALQQSLLEFQKECDDPGSLIRRSNQTQQRQVQNLLQSCKIDLESLRTTLAKHRSLTSNRPRFRDRWDFGTSQQAEVRGKLRRHTEKFNFILNQLHSSSLSRIESNGERHTQELAEIRAEIRTRLRYICQEVRAGRKDPSLLIDVERWSSLERELIDDRISERDVEINKGAICEWLAEIQSTWDPEEDNAGAFSTIESKVPDLSDGSSSDEDGRRVVKHGQRNLPVKRHQASMNNSRRDSKTSVAKVDQASEDDESSEESEAVSTEEEPDPSHQLKALPQRDGRRKPVQHAFLEAESTDSDSNTRTRRVDGNQKSGARERFAQMTRAWVHSSSNSSSVEELPCRPLDWSPHDRENEDGTSQHAGASLQLPCISWLKAEFESSLSAIPPPPPPLPPLPPDWSATSSMNKKSTAGKRSSQKKSLNFYFGPEKLKVNGSKQISKPSASSSKQRSLSSISPPLPPPLPISSTLPPPPPPPPFKKARKKMPPPPAPPPPPPLHLIHSSSTALPPPPPLDASGIMTSPLPPPPPPPPLGMATVLSNNEDTSSFLCMEIPPGTQDPFIELEIPVTLQELYIGTVQEVVLKRTIYDVDTGRPLIQALLLSVPIKSGSRAGDIIDFALGEKLPIVCFVITELPSLYFLREDDDLFCRIEVTMDEALSGWLREIRHFEKSYSISGEIGTGRRHYIEGAGMPLTGSNLPWYISPCGNLYIEIVVKSPSALGLTSDQEERLVSMIHASDKTIKYGLRC